MKELCILFLCAVFLFACGGEEQAGIENPQGAKGASPAAVKVQVESRCLNSRTDSFCVQAYALIARWAAGEITDAQFVNGILELQKTEETPEDKEKLREQGLKEAPPPDPIPSVCSSLGWPPEWHLNYQQRLHIRVYDEIPFEPVPEEFIAFNQVGSDIGLSEISPHACLERAGIISTPSSRGYHGRFDKGVSLYSYGPLPVRCVYSETPRGPTPTNYPCIESDHREYPGTGGTEFRYESAYGRDCVDNIRQPLLEPDFAFLAYIENNEFHIDDCRRGGKEDCIDTINRIWPPVPGERGSCPGLSVAEPDHGNTPAPLPPVNFQVTSTEIQGTDGFIEKIRVTWERAEGVDYTSLDVTRHGTLVFNKVITETEYTVLATDYDRVNFSFRGYIGEPQDVGKSVFDTDGKPGNKTKHLGYIAGNPGRIGSFVETCYQRWLVDPKCESRRRDLPFPEFRREE